MRSCNASSTCRIDWRPSRWLAGLLLGLGALAAVSVLLSACPPLLKLPLAAWALLEGARLARREALRSAGSVAFQAGRAVWQCGNGEAVAVESVHLRELGPVALLCLRLPSRRTLRLAWWPDTLPSAGRRRLRLACPSSRPHLHLPPMAA